MNNNDNNIKKDLGIEVATAISYGVAAVGLFTVGTVLAKAAVLAVSAKAVGAAACLTVGAGASIYEGVNVSSQASDAISQAVRIYRLAAKYNRNS